MNEELTQLIHKYYEPNDLQIRAFEWEKESIEYMASRFCLNNTKIIYRKAKQTPKKIGQFVTLWKRPDKEICPLDEEDHFDFVIITTKKDALLGQFIFPKSILLEKRILSTSTKEGKRGFRLYPPWDIPTSTQAIKSQKWQSNFFYDLSNLSDLAKIKVLLKSQSYK